MIKLLPKNKGGVNQTSIIFLKEWGKAKAKHAKLIIFMLLITHCKIEPASLENILVKSIYFFEIITCSCIKNLLEFVTISYKVVNELST